MNKKRLTALACTSVLILSTLSGCSLFDKKPKSAAELLEKYNAEDHRNFNMQMDIDMTMDMKAMGQNFSIPMDISYDMDLVEDNAHGNMKMKMNALGQNVDQDVEMYTCMEDDKGINYMKMNDTWMKQEVETGGITNYQTAMMEEGMFDDAEFAYNKEEKQYKVVQKLEKLVDNEKYKEAMNSLGLFENAGLDESTLDELMKKMGEGTYTYIFDEDLNLLSADLDELKFDTSIKQSGITIDMTIDMKLNSSFSKFGEIKPEDVEIPDDVKDKAADVSGLTSGSAMTTEATTEAKTENKSDTTETTESEFVHGGTGEKYPYDEEAAGSINGIALTPGPEKFEDTFGKAGFTMDPEKDGEYTFVVCRHPEYGYKVSLYIFNRARKDAKIADIEENGFYGYMVSCYSGEGPDFKWKDVTWGSKEDEILAAFGEPSRSSKGKGINMLTYEYDNHTSLEFTLSDSAGDGLTSVTFNNFVSIYEDK